MGLYRPFGGVPLPGVGARGSLEQKPQPLPNNQGTSRRFPTAGGIHLLLGGAWGWGCLEVPGQAGFEPLIWERWVKRKESSRQKSSRFQRDRAGAGHRLSSLHGRWDSPLPPPM